MYENIIKALQKTDGQNRTGLTPEQKSRNYQIFDELMKKGVSLEDLLKNADTPKDTGIASEVFSVMEEAVKDDDAVKAGRKKACDIKAQVITEICMKDERYRTALTEYRELVSRTYIACREGSEPLDKSGDD